MLWETILLYLAIICGLRGTRIYIKSFISLRVLPWHTLGVLILQRRKQNKVTNHRCPWKVKYNTLLQRRLSFKSNKYESEWEWKRWGKVTSRHRWTIVGNSQMSEVLRILLVSSFFYLLLLLVTFLERGSGSWEFQGTHMQDCVCVNQRERER